MPKYISCEYRKKTDISVRSELYAHASLYTSKIQSAIQVITDFIVILRSHIRFVQCRLQRRLQGPEGRILTIRSLPVGRQASHPCGVLRMTRTRSG